MKEIILALLVGMLVGAIFQLLRLPLPAPPVFAGVAGIMGIYLGGLLIQRLVQFFQ